MLNLENWVCSEVPCLGIWKVGCALKCLVWEFEKLSVLWYLWSPNLENWLRSGVPRCLIWKIGCVLRCLVEEFGKLGVF